MSTPLETRARHETQPHDLLIFLPNRSKLRGMFLTGSKQKNIFITMNWFGYEMLKVLLKKKVNIEVIYTLQKNKTKNISDYRNPTEIAKKNKIKIRYIKNINEHVQEIKKLMPDYIFVLGWSQIIKPDLLKIPQYGCIGSHPSLLPKNRGRAAIPWHFINNEKYGGITFFFLDEGCDSGDIIAQKKFPLGKKDNAKTYYEKIIKFGGQIIKEQAKNFKEHTLPRKKQHETRANYLERRTEKDSLINFEKMMTEQVFNQVRAVAYIYPTAFAFYKNKKILFEQARQKNNKTSEKTVPGEVVKITEGSIEVRTKDGLVELLELKNGRHKPINCRKYFEVGKYFNK